MNDVREGDYVINLIDLKAHFFDELSALAEGPDANLLRVKFNKFLEIANVVEEFGEELND